MRGNLFFIFN